jgi:hypothetical protein
MQMNELQQTLVTCIHDHLHSQGDRGDRMEACRDLQRVLMGASLWLEGVRQVIDLESAAEPSYEEHLEGVALAAQSVRWVQV